jgi:hypothetical protein
MRGAVGDRQRGSLLEADARGHGDELVGRDQAIFRHAAVEHLAHQAFGLVERVDQDTLADLPAGDAGSDLGDLARHVEADHHRQRHLDARHAAHREHVVIVERRRPHADHHVARDGGGERMVGHDLELVEPAVLAQNERFHGLLAAHRFVLCRLDCGPMPV